MARLRVTEIFHSIQGESSRAGLPTVFIRLTGCPMRCVWCDTTYAFEGGTDCEIEEILDKVRRYPCRIVEVTGGEPLAQAATPELLARLSDEGYTVMIETGGGVSIERVDPRVVLVYDVKCPDSGEQEGNLLSNLDLLKPGIDEVKFVLASRRDYLWALEFVRDRALVEHHEVLFSPVVPLLDPAVLAGWILEDGAPVRLQLQIHKVIWGQDARGV